MPLVTKCTRPRAILASRCCRRYTFSRLPFLETKERVTDLFHYVLGIRIFNLFLGKVLPPAIIGTAFSFHAPCEL